MEIKQTLKTAALKLSARNIPAPSLEAEILLSSVLKKPREFILAHGEKRLTARQMAKFKSLVSKRLKGVPSAYLTGHKEFYGLDFKVDKNVLIPRPETELMVDEALKLVTHSSRPVTLVDVGTGSGSIIITLAKSINNYELPITPSSRAQAEGNYEFIAIDISEKALLVAKKNAKNHQVKIKFLKNNLLPKKFVIRNRELIILANLPYLASAQIKKSPTIKHEPISALDGGADGLKYYRELFKQIKTLQVAGRALWILCEIDPRQSGSFSQLFRQNFPSKEFLIKKDLAGLDRLAIINLKA